MAAFTAGAIFRPRKKKEILKVIPKREKMINFGSICGLICPSFSKENGRSIKEARKNRQKAKIKGEIEVRLHLKIGEAAPQIKLAIIKAKMA